MNLGVLSTVSVGSGLGGLIGGSMVIPLYIAILATIIGIGLMVYWLLK